jgi:site-specific DNA-cytosine methylase
MEDFIIKNTRWSDRTANDPKHRLQISSSFSSTVRREWNRYPQEAHILNIDKCIYRRLHVDEISKIQTFPENYFCDSSLKDREIIAGLGNAVAPNLAQIIFQSVFDNYSLNKKTSIDICAGIGGLSLGLPKEIEHLCLVDFWKPSVDLLKSKNQLWESKNVYQADLREFDFDKYSGGTGLLMGGPPCQPYSNAGSKQGQDDKRDLMAYMPILIKILKPEVFILENVPGLISPRFALYFNQLLKHLETPHPNLKYGVSFRVFNTLDYNIAQSRKRVFIVGVLGSKNIDVAQLLEKINHKKSNTKKNLNDIGVGDFRQNDEWFNFSGDLEYYKSLEYRNHFVSDQMQLF